MANLYVRVMLEENGTAGLDVESHRDMLDGLVDDAVDIT